MMLFVERSRNKQYHSTERFSRSLSRVETIDSDGHYLNAHHTKILTHKSVVTE
jgi:hypothetical protein